MTYSLPRLVVATLWALSTTMFVASHAQADDLNPPPWRGGPLSTSAEWEFLSPATPLAPDGLDVPPVVGDGGGGGPLATILGNLVWDDFDGDGAWIGMGNPGDIAGEIQLDIPNWIDTEPLKLVRIQMAVQQTLFDDDGDPSTDDVVLTPLVSAIDATDPSGPTAAVQTALFESPPDINGIVQRVEDWEIRPNPDFETISISVPVDTLVDQIVVDTISLPEPASALLLALAGVGLVGRRR